MGRRGLGGVGEGLSFPALLRTEGRWVVLYYILSSILHIAWRRPAGSVTPRPGTDPKSFVKILVLSRLSARSECGPVPISKRSPPFLVIPSVPLRSLTPATCVPPAAPIYEWTPPWDEYSAGCREPTLCEGCGEELPLRGAWTGGKRLPKKNKARVRWRLPPPPDAAYEEAVCREPADLTADVKSSA